MYQLPGIRVYEGDVYSEMVVVGSASSFAIYNKNARRIDISPPFEMKKSSYDIAILLKDYNPYNPKE